MREKPCRNSDEKPKAAAKKQRDMFAAQAAKVKAKRGRKL
jgi:hypothetical protein